MSSELVPFHGEEDFNQNITVKPLMPAIENFEDELILQTVIQNGDIPQVLKSHTFFNTQMADVANNYFENARTGSFNEIWRNTPGYGAGLPYARLFAEETSVQAAYDVLEMYDAVRDHTGNPLAVYIETSIGAGQPQRAVFEHLSETYGQIPVAYNLGGGKVRRYDDFTVLDSDRRFIDVEFTDITLATGQGESYKERIKYKPNVVYYHITYVSGGFVQYWSYDPAEELYPVMASRTYQYQQDPDYPKSDLQQEYEIPFYPMAPIVIGNGFLDAWIGLPQFIHPSLSDGNLRDATDELLDTLGINRIDVEDIIKTGQYQFVVSAYVGFLGKVFSDDLDMKKYWFTFFDWVLEHDVRFRQRTGIKDELIMLDIVQVPLDYNYKTYCMDLGKTTKNGVVSPTIGNVIVEYQSNLVPAVGYLGYQNIDQSIIYYRKQVTANTYEEIKVTGLNQTVTLYTFGFLAGIYLSYNKDRGDLVVPLSPVVLKRLGDDELASRILYKNLSLAVHTSQRLYREWYETENFAFFMEGLGVFFAILSFGTSQGIWAAISAAISGSATLFFVDLILIALEFLPEFLIGEVVVFLGDELELDFLVAIAAAITVGGLTSIGSHAFQVPGAEQLLRATGTVISNTNDVIKDEIQDVATDLELLTEYVRGKTEMLQEIMEGLPQSGNMYDPLFVAITDSYWKLYEDPKTFVDRSLLANPGGLVTSYVSRYHEIALKLPESETNQFLA